jgi:phospholipid transport system substrate-binding protein
MYFKTLSHILFKRILLIIALSIQPLLYSQPLHAEEIAEEKIVADPLVIIKSATSSMIEHLTINKNNIAEDPSIVMNIVEELLIPHFATNTISRKVLGKHSRKATKEQKTQFSEAFRFYMVRFYSKVFASYTNQTFKYLPTPEFQGKKKVTIKTQLIQSGSSPVAIDYKMQRSGDSWKITDLKIEGISMVISNKRQFGNQINSDGIDTVIAKLQYKNSKAKTNE